MTTELPTTVTSFDTTTTTSMDTTTTTSTDTNTMTAGETNTVFAETETTSKLEETTNTEATMTTLTTQETTMVTETMTTETETIYETMLETTILDGNGTSTSGSTEYTATVKEMTAIETALNQTGINVIPTKGTSINVTPTNGTSVNVTPTNGTIVSVTPTNGTSVNVSINVTPTNGTTLNGTGVTSSALNTSTVSTTQATSTELTTTVTSSTAVHTSEETTHLSTNSVTQTGKNVTSVTPNISTTTAIPPTTLLPTRPPENVLYSVSSDSYFSDLSANSTPSAGIPVETVAGPFGFGSGVRLESEDENCLHRSDFYSGPKGHCFNDLSNCTDSGLSVSIWVNIAFDEKDKSTRYILSTGGDTEGVPGLAIYYKGVDVHAVVSNGSHYWYVYAYGPVPRNTWSNIGLRWAEADGWEMYVDQERVAKVVYPTPVKGPAKAPIQPSEIAIGCHVMGDPLRFSNYSDGKFDEVVVWFHQLNDTELPYFAGGYDPNSANMSVDDVITIITQKLDLTNPEQHQQAVDILDKMSQPTGEKLSDDSEEQDTQRPVTSTLSETMGNSTTTTSVSDNPYKQSSPGSEHTTIDQKTDKLKKISNVVTQMTKPTSIKLNMTLDEMGSFQNTLKVFSNILDDDNKEEWRRLQTKGNGSASMVQAILQWGIDLTKHTLLKTRSKSFQSTKVTENIVLTTQRMTVDEYNKQKGLQLPNYDDPSWDSVEWREGSSKLPLDSIQLPRELFAELGRPPGSSVYISSAIFNTMADLGPLHVNSNNLPKTNMVIDSKVAGIMMDPDRGCDYSLYFHNVRVTLAHKNKESTLSRKLLFHDESRRIPTIKSRYCARWNPSVKPNGGWDSRGCEMYYTNEYYTICNCDHMGAYAILAQNIQRRMIYPDPDWLMYLKYALYCLSAVTLIFYICTIIVSRHLKDQFHIIRLCICVATLSGSACMFTTDFVRGDRHSCTAVTAVLHYSYVAVACWLLMESHALFGTMMHGIVGGKLKAYLPFAWGSPMLCLGIAILSGFKDYGMEPRCMVSWNDDLKWTLFAPILIFGIIAIGLTSATILNTSFAAIKKEMVFEDVSSVAWGLLLVSITFVFNWIFASLAYLDIEYMSPDFYPIFQVLNAAMGFLIFLFMGLGSKRFRMVLRGKTPDIRHLPSINHKPNDLIAVKPQPKQKGPLQG